MAVSEHVARSDHETSAGGDPHHHLVRLVEQSLDRPLAAVAPHGAAVGGHDGVGKRDPTLAVSPLATAAARR